MTDQQSAEERLDALMERCIGAGLHGLIPDILGIKATLDAARERPSALDAPTLTGAMTEHLRSWLEPDGTFSRGHSRCNELCVADLAERYARLTEPDAGEGPVGPVRIRSANCRVGDHGDCLGMVEQDVPGLGITDCLCDCHPMPAPTPDTTEATPVLDLDDFHRQVMEGVREADADDGAPVDAEAVANVAYEVLRSILRADTTEATLRAQGVSLADIDARLASGYAEFKQPLMVAVADVSALRVALQHAAVQPEGGPE